MTTPKDTEGATAATHAPRRPRRWLLPAAGALALALVAGLLVYASLPHGKAVLGKGRVTPREQIELLLRQAGSTQITAVTASPAETSVYLADRRVLTYIDGDVSSQTGDYAGNGPVEPFDVANVTWPEWAALEEAARRNGAAPGNKLSVAIFKHLREAASAQWELQVVNGADRTFVGALPDLTPVDHDLTKTASLQASLDELGRMCGPKVSRVSTNALGWELRCESERGSFALDGDSLAHRVDTRPAPGELPFPTAAQIEEQLTRARQLTGSASPQWDFTYRTEYGSSGPVWSIQFKDGKNVWCRPDGCHT